MARSTPPADNSSNFFLIAIRGVVEGNSVQLDIREDLLLGRSSKGFQLADPLASLHHAQVSWRIDHWVLRDLGSVSGTFVNGERVTGPRAMELGDVIRIGDTELQLSKREPRSTQFVVLAAMLVLGAVLLVTVFWLVTKSPSSDGDLKWYEPISMGGGAFSETVRLSDSFLRERGLVQQSLHIRRVTDFDENGRDEVWVMSTLRDYVFTFGDDGEAVLIGDVPHGCMDRGRSLDGQGAIGFPALRCPGVVYEFLDGVYGPSHQNGVVLWVRPNALPEGTETEGAKGVVPHRVALRRIERFAGFLATRGIGEPVHYILCDDAVKGAEAQVLTATGEQRWLSRGCVHAPEQLGTDLGQVLAMAFSWTGSPSPWRHALLLQSSSSWVSLVRGAR